MCEYVCSMDYYEPRSVYGDYGRTYRNLRAVCQRYNDSNNHNYDYSNVNRTEWSPIRSVIIRVMTKSDDRAAKLCDNGKIYIKKLTI